MEEFFEGVFTKVLILNTPYEAETVDGLAALGWILANVVKHPDVNKYVYWFQTKRRIYEKQKERLTRQM